MGASNLAARRAAKANRRKAIVAQKRKAEAMAGTLAGQVVNAAALPIRCCLIAENLFETGTGMLILARGSTAGPVTVASFLLDSFCCGVKDVMFRVMGQGKLELYAELMSEVAPLVPVDPGYARKLLRELTRWSASLGFQPHRDFTTVERLFGNVDPLACGATFEFGMGGKPFYISGPEESSSAAGRHVAQLREQVGPDDFDFVVGV